MPVDERPFVPTGWGGRRLLHLTVLRVVDVTDQHIVAVDRDRRRRERWNTASRSVAAASPTVRASPEYDDDRGTVSRRRNERLAAVRQALAAD